MKVLFIGGTGNISRSCTLAALDQGIEVVHCNRGATPLYGPAGKRIAREVRTIICDIRDKKWTEKLMKKEEFDCVADWIAFTPEHIITDIEIFRHRTKQFIFISSASAYHKPPQNYIITESTPLSNPYWEYAKNKIACETALNNAYQNEKFPITIIRPAHTYADGQFPTTFGSRDFTVPQRMIDGRKIVVHGDGQSLWTITHSDDFAKGFVGLIGNPRSIGETYHITSDEALTWDHIHEAIGKALCVEPRIVHIPSDYIAEKCPDVGPPILGDKRYSQIFDNTKIKRIVPGYRATIPFSEGMKRSVAWREACGFPKVQPDKDSAIDSLLAAWPPSPR